MGDFNKKGIFKPYVYWIKDSERLLSRKEEKLVIIIEDDGVGFEIKDSNIYESVGLSNIKKRLAIFSSDSRIEMTSTPGVGTRTVIYIKINEDMTL